MKAFTHTLKQYVKRAAIFPKQSILKLVAATALLITAGAASAQAVNNPYPKTITVNGSAQISIIPDEIYVIVDLKEYDKKGSGKISIDKIKAAFLENCRSIGLPDSTITIASYEGYNGNPWITKKKKKEEMYASISYQVKFSNSKKIDELVEKLDDDATQNFRIDRTSHSKIQEYRQQLKLQAIKAAKEKAVALAAAIDEKAGEAITITEPQEVQVQPYYQQRVMTANFIGGDFNKSEEPAIDFKKITLKFEINVVFALK
ncbi:MAG: SIMPL domain-containing protein [Chitinophagaceae bacterium]